MHVGSGKVVGWGLAPVPVVDVRRGGPVEHARIGRDAMAALRRACLSGVPAPVRSISVALDGLSRSWLLRSPSPFVPEIAEIARISGEPGVWFVNASYEWGCTTRADDGPEPQLRRTLDWPFPGLGRHVEVAIQDGGAGPYANVTWPGAVGVLTAMAPGRFAAAINQAPLFRRTAHPALKPVDMALNALATWRDRVGWPPAHLLRRAFDACAGFDEAVDLLSRTPLARPTLFTLVGARDGESVLVERTETACAIRRGTVTVANDWQPGEGARPGIWDPRGRRIGGTPDSDGRRASLMAYAGHADAAPFGWVVEPVLSPLTRIAVEASPATGVLRVVGYEPPGGRHADAVPATRALSCRVTADGAVSAIAP